MNRDLFDIMKMNGILFTFGEKEDYIDELVDNYDELRDKTVSNFTLMSKTSNGINALVDGVFRKILMTEKEERVIISSALNTLVNGSMVEMFNKDRQKEYYLITGRIIDKLDYVEAQAKLCNQTVNMKGWEKPVPCVFDFTTGLSGIDGVQVKEYTATAKLYIQKNTLTENINLKTRFIFNNSKMDIYKVIDIDSTENKGVYVIALEKSVYQSEDDLENNIGFSGDFDDSNNNSSTDNDLNDNDNIIPIISGADKISIGGQETYTINKNNVVFSLSDNSSAEILFQDGTSCIIKSLAKAYRKNSIIAERDGVIIAKKNIIISI